MNYESSSEDIDSVTKVFTVSIPSKAVEERYNSEIGVLSNKVSIKGFRPGKAPRDLVVKMHGKEVRAEVLNKLITNSLGEIVKEHNINYVGQPSLDIQSSGEGEDLKFKVNFALYPVPELTDYKSFSIKLPKVEVKEEDIDQVVERIRNSNADFQKITDRTKVEAEDVVLSKVVAVVNGEAGGEPSEMRLELGSEQTPPEIREGMIGMEVGESRDIKVPSVGTKTEADIQYRVSVVEILQKVLPELNDEFAKSVDNSISNVSELRVKIGDLLKKDLEQQSRSRAEGLILKELAARHDFQIPQVMIDMEIYNMLARGQMIDPSKVSFEQFNAQPFRERMAKSAEERVKASVLVDKITEAEKLLPSEEETKQWFDEQKERLGEKAFQQFFADRGYVQSAWVDYTRKKGLDFLFANTKIEYISAEEFEKLENQDEGNDSNDSKKKSSKGTAKKGSKKASKDGE